MKVFIENITKYDKDKIRNFLHKLPLKEIFKDKQKILIKPNLLGAFAPEKAVTTNPVVLDALIEYLLEMNKEILLGDSPGGTASVNSVWEKTGIAEIAKKHQIKLVNFNSHKISQYNSGGIDFPITATISEVDAIINVSKYKTHSLMAFTGAIKNLFGLVPGIKKSDYHKEYPDHQKFGEMLLKLYKLVSSKITFNIMDGIVGMEGDGPSAGDPRNFGLLFASESAPALDFVAAKMMGFKIENVLYIQKIMEFDKLKATEIEVPERWQNFKFQNVKIKKIGLLINFISHSPQFLVNIFRKFYNYYPDFNDNCKKCNICVESCPVQAMVLKKDDKHPRIDHSKCIKCMCCHEMCPYSAIYIKKSLLAKFIMR